MQPDNELLRHYAQTGSEVAFAQLVQRHVNLVYSTALRQVGGDAHLAHDVAQSVFTDLARKASSLLNRESLTGWLYTSVHFAASKLVRSEHRRREREEQFMSDPANLPAAELDWETLRPILDSAMHGLHETDREAVLLRYFENRPYAEVGAKLGLNENAARMRVERALEKLRTTLARRAITTTAALATVISANAVQVAPPALAATLTKTSIAAAGAGTSFALFKLMTLFKVGLGAIAVAAVAAAMVFQNQAQQRLHNENDSLRRQLAELKAANVNLSNQLSAMGDSQSFSNSQLAELLKLRSEVTQLHKLTNSAVASAPARLTNDISAEKKPQTRAQIFLSVKFISAPESVLQTSAAGWAPVGNGASLLSEDQLRGFNKWIEQDATIRIITAPKIVTMNGREARVGFGQPVAANGTNVDLGSGLDVTPYFSPDSSSFTLNLAAHLNQLTGNPSQPILETIQATNEVNLLPSQTVVMMAKISSAGIPGDTSGLPNRPGALLIFVTPTLIDDVGNRIPDNTPAADIVMVGDSPGLGNQ